MQAFSRIDIAFSSLNSYPPDYESTLSGQAAAEPL